MIKFLKSLFSKKEALQVEENPQVPAAQLAAQPIHINISNLDNLERNKARIARLERSIELGKSTPEIKAELKARLEGLEKLKELVN